MMNKHAVEAIIEDCLLRIETFDARHDSHARGKLVKIRTSASDGGGLSTYGLSYAFGPADVYECHDDYLYIHRDGEDYDVHARSRKRVESVVFIPYSGIVAIECSPCAYI